jgi:hypothetical protein
MGKYCGMLRSEAAREANTAAREFNEKQEKERRDRQTARRLRAEQNMRIAYNNSKQRSVRT